MQDIVEKIKDVYWVNMVLDNLPVTTSDLASEATTFVTTGFRLGYGKDEKFYINNHLRFRILVHKTKKDYSDHKGEESAVIADSIGRKRKLLDIPDGNEMFKNELGTAAQHAGRSLSQDVEEILTEEEKKLWKYMVVGFEVLPCSISGGAQKAKNLGSACGDGSRQEVKEGAKIAYTYDVQWQLSTLEWASRWDAYLKMPGGKVINGVLLFYI